MSARWCESQWGGHICHQLDEHDGRPHMRRTIRRQPMYGDVERRPSGAAMSIADCSPSATHCKKRNCYTCGRLDGIKHRGGSGPSGQILLTDVLSFWWNHDWMTYRAENGTWGRIYPGGVSECLESFAPKPGDRTGRASRYVA